MIGRKSWPRPKAVLDEPTDGQVKALLMRWVIPRQPYERLSRVRYYWNWFAATRVYLAIMVVFFALNGGMVVVSVLHLSGLAAACGMVGAAGSLIGMAGHFALRSHDPGSTN